MTLEGNRWDPVTTALKAFIQSPTSSGLGVGLQYFPLGARMTEDPAFACRPLRDSGRAARSAAEPSHGPGLVD